MEGWPGAAPARRGALHRDLALPLRRGPELGRVAERVVQRGGGPERGVVPLLAAAEDGARPLELGRQQQAAQQPGASALGSGAPRIARFCARRPARRGHRAMHHRPAASASPRIAPGRALAPAKWGPPPTSLRASAQGAAPEPRRRGRRAGALGEGEGEGEGRPATSPPPPRRLLCRRGRRGRGPGGGEGPPRATAAPHLAAGSVVPR